MTSIAGEARRAGGDPPSGELIRSLARLHGLQLSYTRVGGRRVAASTGDLLGALRALGAPVETPADVPDAYRARRLELWSRVVEPVTVAWGGWLGTVSVRLPTRFADAPFELDVLLEDGESVRWDRPTVMPPVERADVEGVERLRFELPLRAALPFGYHTLRLEAGGHTHSSLVVSAPVKARRPPDRQWGAFLPLYALRSERSWGPGDLTDLEALTEWLAGLGGSVVATLPLLSSFLDEREGVFEPSPYTPVSRMLWNELFVDPTRAPELERSAEARALVRSSRFADEVQALRSSPLVDYRRAMDVKRSVLDAMARTLFAESSPRSQELRRFLRANHRVVDHARFRAACRARGRPWPWWPQAERDGKLTGDGGDCDAYRYHLYVQWLAAQQMDAVAGTARERGSGLYFDFPVGVHPFGYDLWRERSSFVPGGSAGAPPDAFFALGQNWGFPPLHPDAVREHRYRYVIECLRHVFRIAGVVRLDHVMGLHRIYLVPSGADARHGVYLRYQPDELLAILSLESGRSGVTVVGEDLGTVPHAVRQAMARHGLLRTYVLYFAMRRSRRRAPEEPPRGSVASIGTHDLPPFAAFWRGIDVGWRLDGGQIGKKEAAIQRSERARLRRAVEGLLRREGLLPETDDERSLLRAVLAFLAESEARMMLVNLEDLWLETRPQNLPGTTLEYPNWRRRTRHRFEVFSRHRDVLDTLALVDRLRREG